MIDAAAAHHAILRQFDDEALAILREAWIAVRDGIPLDPAQQAALDWYVVLGGLESVETIIYARPLALTA